MVTAHKAESEMEEAKVKVRGRTATATEAVDGSKELDIQIVRLMATLTRAEQGNCPASAPNSPRHRGHGRGQTDRNTPTCPSSHNGWTGLGQTTSAHSSSTASQINTLPMGRGTPKCQMVLKMVLKMPETPMHYSVLDARVGVTWLRSVLPQSRH